MKRTINRIPFRTRNIMKTLNKILALALGMATLTGCSDFLDKSALGQLTTDEFFVTENDAVAAVVGATSIYKDYRYTRSIWSLADITTDDATTSGSDNDVAAARRMENLEFHADYARLSDRWNTCFRAINRALQAIDGIQKMDESIFSLYRKNYLLGEAYFTKAYFYFEAVRTWGDLPIYRSTPQISDKTKKRSPKSEVYALIEEDLLFATQNLPRKAQLDAKDLGRATSDAAWALLAKVYLYQEKYAEAKKAIEDNLLPLVPAEYDLMENFEDNFTMANEHCKESIFEINFRHKSDDWGLTTTGNYSAYAQGPRPFMGYGGNQPLQLLADAFEPGDTRKEGTLLTLDELKAWETPEDFASLEFDHTGYYNQKVYIKPEERIGTEDVFSMPNNLRIFRLSEVYLIYAEAVCKLGTDDALAREYMNKVRRRAGLKDNTTATGEALFDAIINENRYEFAMEGHRYFDLVRTGKAEEVFNSPEFKAVKPNAVYRPGYSELFPIPQSEIDNSQGNIVQNPM